MMYKKKKIQKNIFIVFIMLLLVIIAGLRPLGIDHDSLAYAKILNSCISEVSFIEKEPTFWIIDWLNSIIFNGSIQMFFVIFAFIGVSLKLYAIRNIATFPLMSILTYISFYFIMHEMTQIRVGVSIALMYIAIIPFLKKQYVIFWLLNLIAFMFHYSAIVIPILFYIAMKIDKKKYYIFIPFFGYLLGLSGFIENIIKVNVSLLPNILADKISIYITLLENNNLEIVNPINLGNIFLLSLYYFHLYFIDFEKKDSLFNDTFKFLIKLLGIGFFVLFSMSYLEVFAYRLSNFLFFSIVVLIPNTLLYVKQKIFLIFLIFLYLYYTLYQNIHAMLNI